jgi:6,7-dimethyl-8-ribityllumazine synthase
MRVIEGHFCGEDRRFGLVVSRFNQRLSERLLEGAVDCLRRHGVADDNITVLRVPGAWELPLGLESLAATKDFEGLVAIGVVIRGETPHFEHVCSQSAAGIRSVIEEHGIPVGFGLLTCDSSEQAEERAGGKAGNKGWEAALAALEMVDALARLGGGRQDDGRD